MNSRRDEAAMAPIEHQLQARSQALAEALEQQAATAEILRVISRSPADTQPVFETIAAAAMTLCSAAAANVFTFDGQLLHMAALARAKSAAAGGLDLHEDFRQRFPRPPGRDSAASRAVLTCGVIEIPDVCVDADYAFKDTALADGFRSVLAVPLIRGGLPIGAIAVGRTVYGPFPASQIALLQTFADQAVIAIENTRLFNELEARTAQLTQSVEQLRALSEVGQAVGSTLDLATVLRTIVSRATQLTGMDGGAIYEYEETSASFRLHTTDQLPPALIEALAASPIPAGEGAIGRLSSTREPVAVADIMGAGGYQSRVRDILIDLGYRSLLAVPLLHEDRLLGGLVVNRRAAGEFEPRVVKLLQTFAAQSALAIQNARQFREIEDKSRQLEVAGRHKSAFLANMSHELRTPLNAIIGFTRIVMRRTREQIEAKQWQNLENILGSAQHLLTLINATLDLSRIEAGRIGIDATDVALAPLLEDCVRTIEPLLTDGVSLETHVASDLPTMRVDDEKLRQIVINLLSNAVKFTAHGRIELRAAIRDGLSEITIADTGIGIPADKLEAVFEEFEQVDASSTRAHGGTGLGLAIARRLARAMGGELHARSELGVGSSFKLILPLSYADDDT